MRAAFEKTCSSGQHRIDTGSWARASSAVSTRAVAGTKATEHRRPPLSKKPRTALDKYALEPETARRSKSAKLVISGSSWGLSAAPMNPAVLVDTPSIE